jgi:hypothetical protein
MSVGHGFGNCFNNWDGGGHRGVIIVGGDVIVRGSSDQRNGSSLDLRFSSFDRGSGGGNIRYIGVVSVGVVVVAIIAIIASIVVVEPIVSVVVRVVTIVVVGSVVSISLSFGFSFGLGLGLGVS